MRRQGIAQHSSPACHNGRQADFLFSSSASPFRLYVLSTSQKSATLCHKHSKFNDTEFLACGAISGVWRVFANTTRQAVVVVMSSAKSRSLDISDLTVRPGLQLHPLQDDCLLPSLAVLFDIIKMHTSLMIRRGQACETAVFVRPQLARWHSCLDCQLSARVVLLPRIVRVLIGRRPVLSCHSHCHLRH